MLGLTSLYFDSNTYVLSSYLFIEVIVVQNDERSSKWTVYPTYFFNALFHVL